MPVQGLHLITPSAAVATGTGSSATINANGSVTFSAVTALALNDVFSADYDNYQIVCRVTQSTNNASIKIQMRANGTNSTGNNYAWQENVVDNTVITGTRLVGDGDAIIATSNTNQPNGFVLFVYGPYLSQATVGRSLVTNSSNSARIYESAWSHNVSSAFDGISLKWSSGNAAGLIAVYGMRK